MLQKIKQTFLPKKRFFVFSPKKRLWAKKEEETVNVVVIFDSSEQILRIARVSRMTKNEIENSNKNKKIAQKPSFLCLVLWKKMPKILDFH